MQQSIKTLLNKKKWTGKEVGQIAIAGLVHAQKTKGELLFTQDDLDKMVASLTNAKQYAVYRCYYHIYNSLVEAFNAKEAQHQQFYNGFYRYVAVIQNCMQAEKALEANLCNPFIVTQSQYDTLKHQAKNAKALYKDSLDQACFKLLDEFLKGPTEPPLAIKAELDSLKNEPCTNQRILNNYNRDTGKGYYSMPDGTRSDCLTNAQWRQLLDEQCLEKNDLSIDDLPDTKEQTLKHLNQKKLFHAYKLFFKGIDALKQTYKQNTGRELQLAPDKETEFLQSADELLNEKAIFHHKHYTEQVAIALNFDSPAKWHYYEETPKLSKFDALDLLQRYNGTYTSDIDNSAQLDEFKSDYATLYTLLHGYLKERLGSTYNPEKNFTWSELANAKISPYERLLQVHTEDIKAQILKDMPDNTQTQLLSKRITFSGIAIIQNPQDSMLDDNGNYKEWKQPYLELESIETISQNKERAEEVKAFRELLAVPALRFIFAYNALIDIIADIFDLDLAPLKDPLLRQKTKIRAANDLVSMMYVNVIGTQKEKSRKRELFKQIFDLIEVEDLKPSQRDIDSVTKILKSVETDTQAINVLSNFTPFIDQLMGKEASS